MLVGEIAAVFARSAICRTHADSFELAALVKGSGEDERRRGEEKEDGIHEEKEKEKKTLMNTAALMNGCKFLGDDEV